MKEFKINKHLSLKLENSQTHIYVNGHRFRQCKYLLINIPLDEVDEYKEIDSIDEASEKLSGIMEFNRNCLKISPETEFIAHCSNLQAWAEHNYDTRLLEKRLAFPLLKALMRGGDLQAKKVFKEEIAFRLESGYIPVIEYLVGYNYLRFFSQDELAIIFKNISLEGIQEYPPNRAIPLLNRLIQKGVKRAKYEIKKIIIRQFKNKNINFIGRIINKNYLKYLNSVEINEVLRICPPINQIKEIIDLKKLDDWIIFFLIKHNKIRNPNVIKELDLTAKNLTKLPSSLGSVQSLVSLELSYNSLTNLPHSIFKLKALKYLWLDHNSIKKLHSLIGNLSTLRILSLSDNHLTSLPQSLSNLLSLRELRVENNQLSTLPYCLSNISKLKVLNLESNQFISFPRQITDISSLEVLNLNNNYLKYLPDSIGELKSLKILRLENNQIKILPDSIGKLKSLRILNLGNNNLKELPKSIGDLKSLAILRVGRNKINSLPKSMGNLKSLNTLDFCDNTLTYFPPSIDELPFLTELGIKGNKDLAIPPNPLRNLNALIELNLNGKIEKLDNWL